MKNNISGDDDIGGLIVSVLVMLALVMILVAMMMLKVNYSIDVCVGYCVDGYNY